MVLPIIDEDRRRRSMERCPKFEGCASPLCPLDPYLREQLPVPGKPLCYWYLLAHALEQFVDMPPCVADRLPVYIVHLFDCGVFGTPELDLSL